MDGSFEGASAPPRADEGYWHRAADRLVATLAALDAGASAPAVGDVFPDLALPDARGRLVGLASLLDRGPVVLSFHRGLWCPWCVGEIESWRGARPALDAAGARLVAVTPELGGRAADMAALLGPAGQVLCDVDFGATLSLGLGFFVGADLIARYQAAGMDLDALYGAASGILPIPATFVIGRDRIVRFAHVDRDFRHRADPADVLSSIAGRG
ncbi:redoxin domain-containing protein [Sphingomonas changnyeongensis]|uniref:Redoxin domain-containing protein n=1 Tax=Sphingomonas changnyeongensis TaxID=2698679 RepID=A0A7Z2NXH4_9SPHN|nr:peroxiredoxin-like family protein [Sphingomonas changnyeongensis]QHL91241.1 redoxin domain-containing protein [Sphingomonas changnyeongensis]